MAERKVWFITRPERDPQFHAEAVTALKEATDNFTKKWEGNRELHKHYESVLAAHGLKRNNVSNDGSGGRTWCAMLKTFSYCYIDKEGFVKPTKVGKALVNGVQPYENVKKQILTLQIPNAYFMEKGFRPKFEEGFRIRPARFLIKLVQRADLEYRLSKEEITYFVLTAQKDSQEQEVVSKILSFRSASPEQKEAMKQEVAVHYDHRARNDKAARDYYQAHSDVAHTFMLLCEYTALVEYQRGTSILTTDPSLVETATKSIAYYDTRYPFNTRYLISVERMAQNSGLDIDSYKSNEFGDIKPAINSAKMAKKIEVALSKIPNPTELTDEELLSYLEPIFGKRDALKAVSAVRAGQGSMNHLSEDFVERYLGNMTHNEFERTTTEILKAIGFETIYQPKIQGKQTEIEILIRSGSIHGIIDTKHYPNGFGLTQQLANYMASEYIQNYMTYDESKLEFYGYVTSGGFTGEKKLESITSLAKKLTGETIEGLMITREVLIGFLDYCLENQIPREERVRLFIENAKNKGFNDLKQFV